MPAIDAVFQGFVHAELEDVWSSFRGFGASTRAYWSLVKEASLVDDAEDEVGAVRVLTFERNVIKEKLESRDDEAHVMKYSLVSIEPNPGVKSYVTTASLTEASPGIVCVLIECHAECSSGMVANGFRKRLETVSFPAIVQGLELLHNPTVAILCLKDLRGLRLPKLSRFSAIDPYVKFSVVNSKGHLCQSKETKVINNNANPVWPEEMEFSVAKSFDRLRIELFDSDCLNNDDFVFGGEVGVGEIKAKMEKKKKEKPAKKDLEPEPVDAKAAKKKSKLAFKKKCKEDNIERHFRVLAKEGNVEGAVLEFNLDFTLNDGVAVTSITTVALMEKQQQALRYVSNMESLKQQLQSAMMNFVEEPYRKVEYTLTKFNGVDLTGIPGSAKIMPIDRMLKPKYWARMVSRQLNFIYGLSGHNDRLEDEWTAVFNPDYVPMPPSVEKLSSSWQDDAEFCRQFFQGVNPFQVKVVQELNEVPKEMRALKSLDENETSVADIIEEKRLLIADYEILSKIPGKKPEKEGFYRSASHPQLIFYAPIVLLHSCDEDFPSGHNLRVLGIQLTRFKDKPNQIFTPESPSVKWLYAKMLVQSADAQVMQFVNHLGMSHLGLEPVAIAFHNWKFELDEDIFENATILKMLEPHLDNVVGVNWAARQLLIGEAISLVDNLSAGREGGISLANVSFSRVDFDDFCFPRSIAKRGFATSADDDGFRGFYYRDDGFLLWEALNKYAAAAVDATYDEDEGVAEDERLQQFVSDIADPLKGNLSTFRTKNPDKTGKNWEAVKIDSKEALTEMLTAIIFQASAFHSAQNDGQLDCYGYVPNKPFSLKLPMPAEDEELEMEDVEGSLPNFINRVVQCLVMHTLAPEADLPLMNVTSLQDQLPDAHEELMADFESMKSTIEERNDGIVSDDGVAYYYMSPDKCNASVDV